MWEPTPAKLQAISKMCVFMYVGETDQYMWHDEMQREADLLRSKGTVGALRGREGPAAPVGDARSSQRSPAVRRIRRNEEGLQQIAASGRAPESKCPSRAILDTNRLTREYRQQKNDDSSSPQVTDLERTYSPVVLFGILQTERAESLLEPRIQALLPAEFQLSKYLVH
jgi:hypothetical protein